MPLHNFFFVSRNLLESERWLMDKFSRGQAWVDIFGLANHEDGYFRVRGIRVDIKRGQLAHSQVTLSKRWKWSRKKVQNFLNELEKYGDIIQQKNSVTTIITVVKYDLYQSNEQQRNSKGTAKEQQRSTNNKNDKNDKNINNTLPTYVGEGVEDEAVSTEKPVTKKKKTELVQLVEHFFVLKGWEPKGAEFRRHLRAGKDILEVCEGDLDMAKMKVTKIKAWAESKTLSWNLETVLKRWHEIDAIEPEKKKHAMIDGERAYQNERGDWMIIPRNGGHHLLYVGSREEIYYE